MVTSALLVGTLLPGAAAAVDADAAEETVGVVRFLTGPDHLTADGKPAPELVAGNADEGKRIPREKLPTPTPDTQATVTTADEARAIAREDGARYVVPSEKFAEPTGDFEALYDEMTVQECRERSDLSGRPQGWIKNHFAYCQIGVIAAEQYRCTWIFCRKIGSFSARVTHIGTGYQGLREIDWQVYVDEIVASGTSSGGMLTVRAECAGSPSGACFSQPPFDRVTQNVQQWRRWEKGVLYFTSPAQPASPALGEQVKHGTFQFKYDFTAAGRTYTSDGPETSARFDSAWYLPNNTGSIFDRVDPYLRYSLSDPEVDETAQHIYDAQNHADTRTYPKVNYTKTIPGGSAADPLHRLFHNGTRRDQNRAAAISVCRAQWPNYSDNGKDCDEYPFATTYEGSARDQYQANEPYGRFSARALDSADNQEAGSRLGAWYGADRILDGDAFYVDIAE